MKPKIISYQLIPGICNAREMIEAVVCNHCVVSMEALKEKSRYQHRVDARHFIMWLLGRKTNMTGRAIAGVFGLDNASFHHARKTVENSISIMDARGHTAIKILEQLKTLPDAKKEDS